MILMISDYRDRTPQKKGDSCHPIMYGGSRHLIATDSHMNSKRGVHGDRTWVPRPVRWGELKQEMRSPGNGKLLFVFEQSCVCREPASRQIKPDALTTPEREPHRMGSKFSTFRALMLDKIQAPFYWDSED